MSGIGIPRRGPGGATVVGDHDSSGKPSLGNLRPTEVLMGGGRLSTGTKV